MVDWEGSVGAGAQVVVVGPAVVVLVLLVLVDVVGAPLPQMSLPSIVAVSRLG